MSQALTIFLHTKRCFSVLLLVIMKWTFPTIVWERKKNLAGKVTHALTKHTWDQRICSPANALKNRKLIIWRPVVILIILDPRKVVWWIFMPRNAISECFQWPVCLGTWSLKQEVWSAMQNVYFLWFCRDNWVTVIYWEKLFALCLKLSFTSWKSDSSIWISLLGPGWVKVNHCFCPPWSGPDTSVNREGSIGSFAVSPFQRHLHEGLPGTKVNHATLVQNWQHLFFFFFFFWKEFCLLSSVDFFTEVAFSLCPKCCDVSAKKFFWKKKVKREKERKEIFACTRWFEHSVVNRREQKQIPKVQVHHSIVSILLYYFFAKHKLFLFSVA